LVFQEENVEKAEYKVRTNLDLKTNCCIVIYSKVRKKLSTFAGSRKNYLRKIFIG